MSEKTCPPHEWEFSTTHYCASYSCIVALAKCKKCGIERGPTWIERRLNTYEAVLEFIKYLYAGDLKEIDKRYDELPDEVKEAIESHPVYGGDDETE